MARLLIFRFPAAAAHVVFFPCLPRLIGAGLNAVKFEELCTVSD
jgi:hypothetical protein